MKRKQEIKGNKKSKEKKSRREETTQSKYVARELYLVRTQQKFIR